jgi:choline dehydrogenase
MHSDFNMLATLRDRVAMREAVRELISTATSEAFTKIAVEVLIDDEGHGVDDLVAMNNASLDEWIYEHVALVSHATSSCHSIVDDGGMVRGISNLYIADASILQSVPTCTPAGPVVMEASRIARALGETLV